MTKCHWLEPTDRQRRSLRVFFSSDTDKCTGRFSFHNANVVIDEVSINFGEPDEQGRRYALPCGHVDDFKDDPRWPTHCQGCGKQFPVDAERQIFGERIYLRDTGEEATIRDPRPGDMWDAWWAGRSMQGPDGKSLVVVCPDGRQWMIDSRASNCTMKDDYEHRCWIRHGAPPVLTVDKNGHTCAAGAGSIDTGTYHGFLRNGEFTSC